MITNEQQYRITKSAAERFESLAAHLREDTAKSPAPLQQARLQAAESQLLELREQLTEYTALRTSGGSSLELTSLDQLPDALIAARIAKGLTQRELAGLLGVAEQQIQRDEKNRYAHAGFDRMLAVAAALGTGISLHVTLPEAVVHDL